jgi:hypothetical protein
MDCKTARLMLDYARPLAGELDAAEAHALARHLAACPECEAEAEAERRCDDSLGRAMRRIEVPGDLRERVLERLSKDRRDAYHRRLHRVLRWTAAAAAVVLLSWAGLYWLGLPPSQLLPERVWEQATYHPLDKHDLEAHFRRRDLPMEAPNFNLALLIGHGEGEVPGYRGRVVPVLFFHHQAHPGQAAVVYVLDTRRMGLPPKSGEYEAPSGQRFKLQVLGADGNRYQDGDRFAYLVLYDGDDLEWLKPAEPPAT